jgi:hypothetical protein
MGAASFSPYLADLAGTCLTVVVLSRFAATSSCQTGTVKAQALPTFQLRQRPAHQTVRKCLMQVNKTARWSWLVTVQP